jgi:hypothetical protein
MIASSGPFNQPEQQILISQWGHKVDDRKMSSTSIETNKNGVNAPTSMAWVAKVRFILLCCSWPEFLILLLFVALHFAALPLIWTWSYVIVRPQNKLGYAVVIILNFQ